VVGSLRDWEGWSKAHLISVPTLLTNGKYDEVIDISVRPWAENIPHNKWVRFENSSHMAHWEEREKYMEVIAGFLVGKGDGDGDN